MSQISINSNVAHRLAQTASLRAAAELKRIRNDAASDREHLRLMRKVEHEFDGSLGRGGVLKRGLAKIRTNSLTVPAERKRQLKLSTSGRSFHGKGATYSKKPATADDKKRRRAASSGAAHYRYIDSADQCEPLAGGLQISESHVSYIEGCRVETTDDGDRLSSTNIEGSFVDRMRFFELTEGFERNSHGDKITFDPNRPSAELAAATTDPACDPALRAAVAKLPLPHQGKPVKIQLKGTNKDLRRHLKTHGMDLSKTKLNENRLVKDGIAFHTGRSGRTHFRWVFELPVEFTAQQRKMVLEDLCAYMGRQRCMYAAVIHAPDPGNDERNHHLHLIFYDRPCRRLTGTEADLKNVAETFKSDIRKAIAAGQIKKNEWDFTVERHYLSIRTWKTHYPFRAEKSRAVTKGKDWQARFRCNYATIVNEVSVKTGSGAAIYDPRSYNDRDVDISPSKHLGQLHASEVSGIPTLIGLSNERNQANDQRRAIIARHEAEMARLCSFEARLSPYLPGEAVNPRASNWAAHPLRNITDAQHAAEASLAMEFWLLETARERSRATLVQDRQKRASQKGPALERQQREELATAAEMHLAGLDCRDASMQCIINNVQYEIKSATVITAEAVERTASNCAVFTRGYLSSVTPKVTRKQDPDISVAPPTGKPKFKGQIAQLTAGMNISMSNVELQTGIAQQMKATKKHTSVTLNDKSIVNNAPDVPKLKEATNDGFPVDSRLSNDGTAEPRPPVAAPRPLMQPITPTSTPRALPTTGSLPQKTPNDVQAGNRKSSSTHNVDYLPSIKINNWAVRRHPNNPAQMTLYPRDMIAFRIQPSDLGPPEVQAQLSVNYHRQQAELAKLGTAVREGSIHVMTKKDIVGREIIRLAIASGSPLEEAYLRCALHPQFEAIIKLAHGDAMEGRRAVSQAPAGLPAHSESGVGTANSIQAGGRSSNTAKSEVTEAEKDTGFKQILAVANTEGFIRSAPEKNDITIGSASQKPEGITTASSASIARLNDTVQPPTPPDEARPKEQQYHVQKRTPPEDSTEQVIGGQRETPPNDPSMDVLVEKHGRTNEQSGGAITKPTDLDISNEQHAAKQRSAIEEEILHVIRTERIRLKRVDGALVFPAHGLIPAEWHQHAPQMQVQLEEGQRSIEDELKSFANLISTKGYDPTCQDQKLLHKVFEGQPEIVEALAEKQRNATELLAQQHALAANRGFGFS